MHHLAELDVRDVDDQLVGHVLGQALDLHLAQVVLDHAAFLHAHGLAGLVHWHAHRDRLRAAHRQEVDMHELGVDVITLDLTRDGEVLLALDHDVDQHVGAGAGVEQVLQLAGLDRQRGGFDALAVEHGGHLPGGAQLAGDTLAGIGTSFGVELRFHGYTRSLWSGEARGEPADCTEIRPRPPSGPARVREPWQNRDTFRPCPAS